MEKKKYPKLQGRTLQVLTLLSDGKVHLTTELENPPKTRDWPTSQAEDRNKWFWRLMKLGLIELLEVRSGGVDQWKITQEAINYYGHQLKVQGKRR